jgi:hypothetical protein
MSVRHSDKSFAWPTGVFDVRAIGTRIGQGVRAAELDSPPRPRAVLPWRRAHLQFTVAGSVAIIIAVLTAVGTEAKGIVFGKAKAVAA